MLRPTVSRPVCLGIKHPSGAYDIGRSLSLSDEKTSLSFTMATGLASAVILGLEFHGTRDQISLSHI
jgi:hypothetical protein